MKSLTDVVSGAGLSIYAEIALVIFLLAFLGVVISLFVPSRQRTYEHMRHLPIDADPVLQPLARNVEDLPVVANAPQGKRFAQDDNHA